MHGPLAQLVALVCHGNAALRGLPRSPFFPTHSTCRFCEKVEFMGLQRRLLRAPRQESVATTPDAWFDHLAAQRTSGLLLRWGPSGDSRNGDRMSAGFVGGGMWAIEARSARRSSAWLGRWEVGDQGAKDRRIWRVCYHELCDLPEPRTNVDLPMSVARLRHALVEILAFARRKELNFATSFEAALRALDGEKAPELFHRDLAPEGALPDAAAAVLAAAQKAWVFGGMGSWNDMSFRGDEQREYEHVSEALFLALNQAIAAAASASLASR